MSETRDKKDIFVYTHGIGQAEPVLMGQLTVSLVRGKEIYSFEYDPDFLETDFTFEIDPNLGLYTGTQYPPEDHPNFGIFLDSAPDRWGRVLMDRRETAQAKLEERPGRKLMDSDYLLGVFDESRMGALRFKTDPDGPFLDDDLQHATPPITSLRELEHASLDLEDDDKFGSKEYLKQLALLVAPGSSLGGARPKASVKDTDGALWIAKFPSRNDDTDQGAWEFVVYQLAKDCGIWMAESQAEVFYSDRHTFLTRRFDRDQNDNRIHFFSAMTLLGYRDGADEQQGVSYLELVDLIVSRGSEVDKDLEQLWRRIVFSICVSNTDDHLRNHGFLLTEQGLRLSPAYDVNPNPKGHGLTLNIDEKDNALNLDLAREVAPYFRLETDQSEQIISEIVRAVSRWEKIADSLSLSRREKSEMAPAFKTEV